MIRHYWAAAGFLALLISCGCARRSPSVNYTLTSVEQVRRLPANQALSDVQVHLEGVVTFAAASDDSCFVQDKTGGIRVYLAKGYMITEAGRRIELWGRVRATEPAPSLMASRFILGTPAPLPGAVPLQFSDARTTQALYSRVSFAGVVEGAEIGYDGIAIVRIRTGGTVIPVRTPAPTVSDVSPYVDAQVRVVGVWVGEADGMWMPNLMDAEVLAPPPPTAQYSISRIASLRTLETGSLPAHRVRIRGNASPGTEAGVAIVEDESGRMAVSAESAGKPMSGPVDVVGFLAVKEGAVVLGHARDTKPARDVSSLRPVLRTALAVHRLSADEARLGSAVHLRGVVTYSDLHNGLLFVQDDSDGIYVTPEYRASAPLRTGDLVDLDGETGAGDFAPVITHAVIKVLGRAPLPAVDSAHPENIFLGRRDSRWIELPGVVQRVEADSREALLTLVCGVHRYRAHVLAPRQDLPQLVNATVSLRGVSAGQFNSRRQMLGVVVQVPGKEYIQVVHAAPPDPFALPLRSALSVMEFTPTSEMDHLIRLQGVVTYSERFGPTWIRDATDDVLVQDHEEQLLKPGDAVNVAGFAAMGPFSPALTGGLIRKTGIQPPPRPKPIKAEEGLTGSHDAELVQVEGTVIERTLRPGKLLLLLRSGGVEYSAEMHDPNVPPGVQAGARLRITGICSVLVDDSRTIVTPRSFQILIRTAADVTVLKPAPWLTLGRLLPVFGITFGVAGAALLWASWLRRRVKAQTKKLLIRSTELEAALERAREAESIEQAHKDVLELVARDETLDVILLRLAQAVEDRCPGVFCSLQVGVPGGTRVSASPGLPAEWQHALAAIAIEDFSDDGIHALEQLSGDPCWAAARQSAAAHRFDRVRLCRIRQESKIVGVLVAFLSRDALRHGLEQGFLLSASKLAALAAERRALYNQLAFRAQYDELTGLENRASFFEKLSREIEEASREGSLLAVLYVDLDGFKGINDSYGHDAGDAVLREVAARMTGIVRRSDTLARLGGDEFAVLLPGLGDPHDVARICANLERSIARPISYRGYRLTISASVGMGFYPTDGLDCESLLRTADGAMYREKSSRDNRAHQGSEGILEPEVRTT